MEEETVLTLLFDSDGDLIVHVETERIEKTFFDDRLFADMAKALRDHGYFAEARKIEQDLNKKREV